MHKGTVLLRRFCLQHPGDHLQSSISQTLNATTSNPWIRVFECHNHALNAGLNHCLRAGGRAALVTTWLKRDDDRAALGARPSLSECAHLGMGFACFGVKALANQGSLQVKNHCPHQGVGAGLAVRQGC